jgi:hypothetical protein
MREEILVLRYQVTLLKVRQQADRVGYKMKYFLPSASAPRIHVIPMFFHFLNWPELSVKIYIHVNFFHGP